MNRECIVIVKETDVEFSMEIFVPRTQKNASEQISVRSFCPCVDPKLAQNLLYPFHKTCILGMNRCTKSYLEQFKN